MRAGALPIFVARAIVQDQPFASGCYVPFACFDGIACASLMRDTVVHFCLAKK